MRLEQYLVELKKIERTMIGFSVNQSKLSNVYDHIKEIMFNHHIDRYEIIDDPHISIAQIPGKVEKDKLIRAVHSISKNVEFVPKKLKILEGKRVPFDFITIEYKKNNKFINDFNKIAEEFEVIKFPGGNIPHVSLFKLNKGQVSKDFIETIEELKIKIPYLKPTKVVMYNQRFELEYKK
ncbi:MAG: hypothetical protein ACOC56_01645 [Atribacterota bacterium]